MILNWKEEITKIDPDCNKEGTAKKTQQDYRLFRFRDGKVRLLDMVIDGKQGWAVDLWDALEGEI